MECQDVTRLVAETAAELANRLWQFQIKELIAALNLKVS